MRISDWSSDVCSSDLRLSRADEPFSDAEEKSLEPLRHKLFSARAPRIRPGFDDKILSDWNGLMITSLAEAGATFNEPSWIEASSSAYADRKDTRLNSSH